jgi:hypothetical protein
VGLSGVQRPEFKRSKSGSSFDIGVTTSDNRGFIGLKAPKPVVIVGEFEQDKEDPASLEEQVKAAMRDSAKVKPWFEIAKHPNVYRIAGSYTLEGRTIKLKVYLQAFDAAQARRTLETFDLSGTLDALGTLCKSLRDEVEARVKNQEELRLSKTAAEGAAKPPD